MIRLRPLPFGLIAFLGGANFFSGDFQMDLICGFFRCLYRKFKKVVWILLPGLFNSAEGCFNGTSQNFFPWCLFIAPNDGVFQRQLRLSWRDVTLKSFGILGVACCWL